MTQPKTPTPLEFFSLRDLTARWRVNPATPYRWVSEGILEPPVRLGPRCARWTREAIEKFEATRFEAPDAK